MLLSISFESFMAAAYFLSLEHGTHPTYSPFFKLSLDPTILWVFPLYPDVLAFFYPTIFFVLKSKFPSLLGVMPYFVQGIVYYPLTLSTTLSCVLFIWVSSSYYSISTPKSITSLSFHVDWCGTHHYPPSTNPLSNWTNYLGRKLGNITVP